LPASMDAEKSFIKLSPGHDVASPSRWSRSSEANVIKLFFLRH